MIVLYGKNQCDLDFCYDVDKIQEDIQKEDEKFDQVLTKEKWLFTCDTELLCKSKKEEDQKN